MLTHAPPLRLGDLAALFGHPQADDETLAQPWMRDGERVFWFSRGAWTLRAIVSWWQVTHRGADPVLWLPDYFCNQSTSPVRAAGARLRFYPVGEDLEPRWEACRLLATGERPHLFVLVHYFGAAADAPAAREFCLAHDAVLIEDAAHVLARTPGIGGIGEFVFFSPRKCLAIPDGALLLVRDEDAAADMDAAARRLGRTQPQPWTWLGKRTLQRMIPTAVGRRITRRRARTFEDDPAYAVLPSTPALSGLARRLLARSVADLSRLAADRTRNGVLLELALADVPGCRTLSPEAGAGTAPYRSVVRFDDPKEAARVYSRLQADGVPVETWPDLPPEVTADPGRHEAAIALRRSMILLPVHQPLDRDRLLSAWSVAGRA